ncbi:MAG: hypothetical protein IBX47_09005 [Desulfuromonadales bacterium]|nr:hypothetical protein [Desulfuromonadales bacterium]
MKFKSEFFSIFALIGVLGIAPLCYDASANEKTSATEIKQETQALLQTLKTYTIEQKDEAIAATGAALNRLDRDIDVLEKSIDKRWSKMDEVTCEKARASLKKLRTQRTQVAEWYGSLKSSAAGSWEHIKEGFSDAYKSLDKAWEKSEQEFNRSQHKGQ